MERWSDELVPDAPNMDQEATNEFIPDNDAAPEECDKLPNDTCCSALNLVYAGYSDENNLKRDSPEINHVFNEIAEINRV